MTMQTDVTDDLAHHKENYDKTVYGFWVYLMTDCILFGMLFATFAVLRTSTYGGPSGKDLFSLPFVLLETFALLASSFTSGLAGLAVNHHKKGSVIGWHIVTFLLGALFVGLELYEFVDLVKEGHSWKHSAFLSAFFTLVATHGFHVSMGLLWMVVMMFQIHFKGLTWIVHKRLTCLRLFWHFLDVVWIFIFTYVYLLGVL
jgi:cytochrome o ubiquinol oxidase subunit III